MLFVADVLVTDEDNAALCITSPSTKRRKQNFLPTTTARQVSFHFFPCQTLINFFFLIALKA